jgi:hypothetical protein
MRLRAASLLGHGPVRAFFAARSVRAAARLKRPALAASLLLLLLVAVAPSLVSHPALASASPSLESPIVITAENTGISATLGEKFVVRTTITNHGAAAVPDLVAHLDVFGFDPEIPIDPEDWSSERTRALPTLKPGESVTLGWTLHAVNLGTIALYVAVVPAGESRPDAPFVGPTILVAIAERATVSSGSVLPIAFGVPVVLGLLAFGVRLRRRIGPSS